MARNFKKICWDEEVGVDAALLHTRYDSVNI